MDRDSLSRADLPIFVAWFCAAFFLHDAVADGGRFWTALLIAFAIVAWGKVTHDQGAAEGVRRERAARQATGQPPTPRP